MTGPVLHLLLQKVQEPVQPTILRVLHRGQRISADSMPQPGHLDITLIYATPSTWSSRHTMPPITKASVTEPMNRPTK